ncbi:hypothetical protein SDC9_154759 [bioreactor metagenome]|uniref:Uncharacterized protein n=1 Tax=bioreactor metagenome TaxID=1076179 RepID=A0A645F236_9ZZZZ
MDAIAGQPVEVTRQRGHQRFSFTGFHFRDTSLMQDDSADELDIKMTHSQNAH